MSFQKSSGYGSNVLGHVCACSDYSIPTDFTDQITSFYKLRDTCPALRLTIPDHLLNNHRLFTESKPDGANHCSVPFLAFRRNCLAEFTESLHCFALNGAEVGTELTPQYRSDVQESWLLQPDEISRFKAFRIYMSRNAEFHFAFWLKNQQWQITNMEMYGGQFDIEGQENNSAASAFEIKFLAQREIVFELNIDSFNSPTVARLSVYSPVDYLLFRLYEAAVQLHHAREKRIAVAIVEDYEFSFEIPLSENWINWSDPQFLKRDSEINEFLTQKYKNNANLDFDLKTRIAGLSEIWVMSYTPAFGLVLKHKIVIKN